MNVTAAVLRRAIQSHAVLLNRRAWLDEQVMDLQMSVWRDAVQRQPGAGSLVVEDFERAIAMLIEIAPSPAAVVPTSICREAARIAAARHDLATRTIREWRDGTLLYDETAASAFTPDAVYLEQLQRAIDARIHAVAFSEGLLDADEKSAILADLAEMRR